MYSCNSVFGRPVLNINEENAQSGVEESDIEGIARRLSTSTQQIRPWVILSFSLD